MGVGERMRVPRPPAMTTAASLGRDSDTVGTLAGAPGFEPGITGPKPVALPLGHAPVNRDAECTRTPGHPGRRLTADPAGSRPVPPRRERPARRARAVRRARSPPERERRRAGKPLRATWPCAPPDAVATGRRPRSPATGTIAAAIPPTRDDADHDEHRLDRGDPDGDLGPPAAKSRESGSHDARRRNRSTPTVDASTHLREQTITPTTPAP